jgi:sugar lactone lactonase YvrE
MLVKSKLIRIFTIMKVSKKILLIALWLLTFANYIYSQNIYTIAGTGNPNFSGDGGFAINADMYNITGIARDKTGNIFICDNANHRIRKIDVNGIITTIAGGGTSSADSIPAMSALVGKPWGICSDNFGNVYFTDGYLNQVRKINPAGMIITVAGQASTSGGFSGDGGPAKSALFKYICNLTIDKTGNIYISDFGNGRIRKVDTSGMISTIAGTTTASLGNGGPATAAKVSGPAGVAFDKYGNLYIGELYSYLIRKVDTLGIITTIAGNGTQGYSGDGGSAINASSCR